MGKIIHYYYYYCGRGKKLPKKIKIKTDVVACMFYKIINNYGGRQNTVREKNVTTHHFMYYNISPYDGW